MKKKFLALITLMILAGIGLKLLFSHWAELPASLPPLTEKYLAENGKTPAGPSPQNQSVLKPIDLSKPIRLAIGGMGLADNNRDRQLGDLATVELTGAPGFILVERASLGAILQELNLSWSGFVRAKDAVRVGKLLKVDWFLLGTEARLNGTNCIVVRLVDAHTGIMRDADVFPSEKPSTILAKDLAAFARRTRDDAAKAKLRVYLAIGGFQDVSQNNRRADFIPQLRNYLTAAYQDGNVALLEREYVETLLQEMNLDLAGLTLEEGTNSSATLQSAFWLVRGQYQSYETTNYQVEVYFNIQRIFGRAKYLTLRGPAGDPINRQIKGAIDEVMKQSSPVTIPSRMSEARAQMVLGEDLIGASDWHDYEFIWPLNTWTQDSELFARRKRNFEEAMRSFQTVLLLEPTNREARMFLGVCLRDNTIHNLERARDYYFEIIDESTHDRWSEIAKSAVWQTFVDVAEQELEPTFTIQWYEAAAMRATNSEATQYFRSKAETLKAKLAMENDPSKAEEITFVNLLSSITNSWFGDRYSDDLGVNDYVWRSRSNSAVAAQKLVEYYPRFKAKAPELDQEILASIVTAQVDTNASVVVEFREMIEEYATNRERIPVTLQFWPRIWPVIQWSYAHKDYDLALKLIEGVLQFRASHPKETRMGIDSVSDDRLALAYVYFKTQKWDKALAIFEGFGDRPLRMEVEGPWGGLFTMVQPREFAETCRAKLGLPSLRNPNEFSMGKFVLWFGMPSAFAVDVQGLWIGGQNQLIHLDFDLKTNAVVNLPLNDFSPITCIYPVASNIWIGTGGGGLIKYDQTSKKSEHYTVSDGMLMNAVASLHMIGDTLWIGYGRKVGPDTGGQVLSEGGGLGKLDVLTGKFVSFTRSMISDMGSKADIANRATKAQPPRDAVVKISGEEKDKVWVLTDGVNPAPQLFQYQSKIDTWVSDTKGPDMEADSKRLVLGRYGTPPITILNLQDGQWHGVNATTNLPAGMLTAIALDGENVWVGGMGFLAQVDISQDKILRLAYLNEQSVDSIQVGGGYVWAQCRWKLYRAPLSKLK